ncbi:serine/threonine-protein kinase Chk2 isoform X2 [Nematostella vectensis]|uniref:serine/threonine-protein kinase Chk2 isoform X2 n=1 Tax=Nematostella vectensis TaxID=45351 RepID=UPI0013900031|nr:serine/threonine-protein kinase Chk2 isoform X2 [Nematostella vectensis]
MSVSVAENTPSSSSGDPSSHSSQSQSVPSSMDSGGSTAATVPTQDMVDGVMSSDEEEDVSPCGWGRLFPLGPGFQLVELIEDEYMFGRGSMNNCRFDATQFKLNAHYQAFSTKHLKIVRKQNNNNGFDVFITDLSSNGTYVNGEKIGKNKTHVLNHNDEISLSVTKNKAYIFQELGKSQEEVANIPEDFRKKYTLSKLLGRGAFGEVRLAFTKGTCHKFAVKLISKRQFSVSPYLHSKGITHRDLKPENILLCSDKNETLLKITDFGVSKMVGEQSLMKTLCGTPSYLAPEVLRSAGLGGYSKAVDCWSLGCMLYICLGGYAPFSDEVEPYDVNKLILAGKYTFPKQHWKCVSDEAIDLIKKLLTVDPSKRLTIQQVLEHPWIKDEEVIEKANRLMYSGKQMPPPTVTNVKKRSSNEKEDEPASKREKTDKCEPDENCAANATSS